MRIRIWTTLCLSLLVASCSLQEEPVLKSGPQRVTIGTQPGIGIESRTALGDDGFSVRWVKGDRIALWALNSADEVQLSAVPFTLYSFDETYRSAKFTGTIDPMPEDTYTYCALSPVPASTEGTKGIYSIPAVQDGTYLSDCDVMAAMPVSGGGLVSGDNSADVSFAFAHKVHLLKIRIPENKMGEPLTGLLLTFPVPVTGTLKVDAANPDAAPELIDGSNTLTLEFPAPLADGAVVYAMIAPVALDATVPVSLTGICERGESKSIRIPGKNFAAGHSTPISFTIPEFGKVHTKVALTIDGTGEQTLGEKVERFTVTGPEGVDLGYGTNSCTFDVDAAGTYEIRFRDGVPAGIPGATFTATYESANAVVSNTFVMPDLTAETTNTVPALTVPYLMYEDFAGTSSFTGGSSTSGGAAGNDMSGSGLTGWVGGQRLKIEAGKCAVLRHYSNIGGPYHSRIDTAPFTSIKEGKSVSLKVTFNCDWKKNKSGSMGLIVGLSTATNLNSSIANGQTVTLINNQSANADNIPTAHEVIITSFVKDGRIAWKTNGTNGSMFNYDDVYLDNIRVSIAR